MGEKLLGMVTWMLAGYLTGLTIGFSVFDPDTDIYALLGATLAILGLLLGLTPLFRRYTHLALGGITGFYLASLLGIFLLGTPATDNLPEVAGNGAKLGVALAGTVVGITIVYRLKTQLNSLLIAAFLFGGFFGGLLLAAVGIAPRTAMVGLAPFFLSCGVLCAAIVAFLQRRVMQKRAAPQ
jgi:hypothetical protein